jgi:uncharacterized HhH-GPD family protein
VTTIRITGDAAADGLLGRDPLAILVGMALDQQIPMEKAFSGPAVLLERLGHLDAARIADTPDEVFLAAMKGPPAVHRFPGSMGKRVQELCAVIARDYGNDAASIWTGAKTGEELLSRLEALPGFGRQKAQIFVALLGKQLKVRPRGWREAAGAYGEDRVTRSVADVTSKDTLLQVRAYKQAAKAAAREQPPG